MHLLKAALEESQRSFCRARKGPDFFQRSASAHPGSCPGILGSPGSSQRPSTRSGKRISRCPRLSLRAEGCRDSLPRQVQRGFPLPFLVVARVWDPDRFERARRRLEGVQRPEGSSGASEMLYSFFSFLGWTALQGTEESYPCLL